MKKIIVIQLTAILLLSSLSQAEWREFTSVDGSKKVRAEVRGYDEASGMVALRLEGNRAINAPVSAFIEEDQAFIKKAVVTLLAGRNLWIEFLDEETEVSEKRNPTNGYRTVKKKSGYKMEMRNNSTAPFEGLTADYQIFYASYSNPSKDRSKSDKVKFASMDLPVMQPRQEVIIETESINLTEITKLPLSECKGGS
jgi:hypothetical protein